MSENTNILVVGIGGQGVMTATEILAEAAIALGHDVKKTEVAGMAQVTAGCETTNFRKTCAQFTQSISAAQPGSGFPCTRPNSAPPSKGRLAITAMRRSAASGSN